MTQTAEILYRLELGPVCGTDLLRMYIPRYAARIYDLRNQGHNINTRRCKNPEHRHQTPQIEYVLATDTLF